ncbi:hypothetical protein SIM97_11135 [Pectobacterium zantedeschiae]|uniref:hypothetical protein n=1 Tax=Pectobacterium zantedeschiae TaxID=2034769 RepID=UPI0037545801
MHDFLNEVYGKIINKSDIDIVRILDYMIESYNEFEPNWHALGFIHCKILKNDSGTLRLHIWHAQEKHADEQVEKIHDHLFSLNSFIISGKIKNEFFNVEKTNKNDFTHYAYIVKYIDEGSYLTSSENFYNVCKLNEKTIVPGEYYTIDSSEFHRSSLANGISTLTLVATYNHLEKDPLTLSSKELESCKIRKASPYNKDKWRDILINFRKEITIKK